MTISPNTSLQGFVGRANHPEIDRSRSAAPMILALGACLCLLIGGATLSVNAQTTNIEAAPAAGSPAILNVIRWSGSLPEAAGRTAEIKFALYQDQAGGLALWNETQTVKVGADGKYSVLLGATSAEGLPSTLFQAGQARWIEAKPATAANAEASAAPPRSLLAAVPYAVKAADAETLAGRAAADYVTREDLQSTVASSVQAAAFPHPDLTPTGSGTTNYLPLWTGTSTLGNSVIYESGTNLGIGTTSPLALLDVNGQGRFEKTLKMSQSGLATASTSIASPSLLFQASAYSSSLAAPVAQTFLWNSWVSGNNTASPSSDFGLSYSTGTGSPVFTGLYIKSNGQINFAPGQTFPGAGAGTITGVTATSPITGGGTSGSVSVGLNTSALETTLDGRYAKLSGGNIFSSYLEAYQTAGPGNAALLGWGSKGSVGAFGDSDTGYGVQGESTSGHGVYAQVTTPGAGSSGVLGFTGSAFSGSYTSEQGIANAGVWADNSKAGSGVPVSLFATGDDVYGAVIITNGADYPALFADNNGGAGIVATAANGYGVSASTSAGTGVYGSTSGGGDGVEGLASSLGEQQAGVLGIGNNASVVGGTYNIYSGIWGDTGTSSTTVSPAWAIGVLGTADDSHAGVFLNNSSGFTTLFAENYGTGATGLFRTLMAKSNEGACGIGGNGDLSCTGQIKSLVSSGGGTRRVETYAVQSPENWMEDFGSGELKRGSAVIAIDPAFAETVSESADYHVFLTPRGDSKGLYVTKATATSFEVRESGGGTSSLGFDYRIVAKRRGYENQRLTDVTERFNAESAAALPRASQGPVRHAPPQPARSPLQLLHPGVPRPAPVQMRHPTPERAVAQATPEAKH